MLFIPKRKTTRFVGVCSGCFIEILINGVAGDLRNTLYPPPFVVPSAIYRFSLNQSLIKKEPLPLCQTRSPDGQCDFVGRSIRSNIIARPQRLAAPEMVIRVQEDPSSAGAAAAARSQN